MLFACPLCLVGACCSQEKLEKWRPAVIHSRPGGHLLCSLLYQMLWRLTEMARFFFSALKSYKKAGEEQGRGGRGRSERAASVIIMAWASALSWEQLGEAPWHIAGRRPHLVDTLWTHSLSKARMGSPSPSPSPSPRHSAGALVLVHAKLQIGLGSSQILTELTSFKNILKSYLNKK